MSPMRRQLAATVLALAAVAARGEVTRASTPYVDGHAHFDERDVPGSIRAALAALDRENAAAIFFQAPPDIFEHPGHYDAETILSAAKEHPGKLAVLGGGGTLNAMIHDCPPDRAGPEIRKRFEDRAGELLREGVVGFGELTAEHFAGVTPYQASPPDHPLFLLLVEIAARHGAPIDLHMEAVPKAMPLPAGLKSPPNAPVLRENIAAFERLLAHRPQAAIIWAHAGSDGTGFRTPELCRRLLKAHPNLYMELKVDPKNPGLNSPLANGKIKPDWLQLLKDFPDRFIIGSDQHYPEPPGAEQRWQAAVLLLDQLPLELRRKVASENALRIYARTLAGERK